RPAERLLQVRAEVLAVQPHGIGVADQPGARRDRAGNAHADAAAGSGLGLHRGHQVPDGLDGGAVAAGVRHALAHEDVAGGVQRRRLDLGPAEIDADPVHPVTIGCETAERNSQPGDRCYCGSADRNRRASSMGTKKFRPVGASAVRMPLSVKPSTRPCSSSSGPPLLPGSTVTSLWMKLKPSRMRLADTTPRVTVFCSLGSIGAPMANTVSPGCGASRRRASGWRPRGSVLIRATSRRLSVRITSPTPSSPSDQRILTYLSEPTTCSAVIR